MPEVTAEDSKLIVLARAARIRLGSEEAAAVCDTDGRTYVACSVQLSSLRLTALQTAVALAMSSGADQLSSAVVVTDAANIDEASLAVLREVAPAGAVLRVDGSGTPVQRISITLGD